MAACGTQRAPVRGRLGLGVGGVAMGAAREQAAEQIRHRVHATLREALLPALAQEVHVGNV